MHPSRKDLLAFCDGEAGSAAGRRVSKHLLKCEKCAEEIGHIESEKNELALRERACTAKQLQSGLSELTSSMSAWREGQSVALASEIGNRVRSQIEVYLGSPALSMVEQPGMRAEELLGRSGEILDALLGPAAAEAAKEEVLSGLQCARMEAETNR